VRIVLWVGCAVGPEDQAWREVAPWVRSVLRHPLAFEISGRSAAAREQIRSSYDFALHMSHESVLSHSCQSTCSAGSRWRGPSHGSPRIFTG